MNITDIQVLSATTGTTVVPRLDDYDDASDGWTESEHRAALSAEHVIGAWTGKPGWVRIDDWPYNEVCVIKSGAVEVEDATGAKRRFEAGDSFMIPQHFAGVWHTLEPCEKVFVGIVS